MKPVIRTFMTEDWGAGRPVTIWVLHRPVNFGARQSIGSTICSWIVSISIRRIDLQSSMLEEKWPAELRELLAGRIEAEEEGTIHFSRRASVTRCAYL
jgi:hypothetical protein